MNNNTTINIPEIVICAIVVIIGGSFGLQGLAISILLVGAYILCAHFSNAIMAGIHAVLQQVPLTWLVIAWAVLTVIAIIGSITYSTSGVQARFINTPVYLVSLVLTVLYMLRRVPESRFFQICALVWSLMTLASIWKLVPFVGWILAICNIVLFLELHHIADRTHQPQQQQRQRHQRNGNTRATLNVSNVENRTSVETVNIGGTIWTFYPKDQNGVVVEFTPRTWLGFIPAFWRHISIVKETTVLSLYEESWCHTAQSIELRYLNDPDHLDTLENWALSLICRSDLLKIDFKTPDGMKQIKFRVWRDQAQDVVSALKILVQEAATLQKVTRLGH